MKIYTFNTLTKVEIDNLCSRTLGDDPAVKTKVAEIVSAVKTTGDAALMTYNKQFEKAPATSLVLEEKALRQLAEPITAKVAKALTTAIKNIRKFHKHQFCSEPIIETMPGVKCWRESRAITSVGIYIPGGSAVLPSTFLMLAIPALIAGCKEIVVCTPPNASGTVNAEIAWCAVNLGIKKIYLTGGAQAIAAMAYGTASVPKTSKIFGPGNRYVTEAKALVQRDVAIDMQAGPSEVLIIADETADPIFIAADLLAQAEHGTDSQCILVSNSSYILDTATAEISRQLERLPRRDIAAKALQNSYFIKTADLVTAMDFSNIYAPEHLILATDNHTQLTPLVSNAGSVFLGHLTPESAGDYASGTNHTLPTGGFAKSYSGVSVDSFLKKITFQELNKTGIANLADTVETLAAVEGLDAHRIAMAIRR